MAIHCTSYSATSYYSTSAATVFLILLSKTKTEREVKNTTRATANYLSIKDNLNIAAEDKRAKGHL